MCVRTTLLGIIMCVVGGGGGGHLSMIIVPSVRVCIHTSLHVSMYNIDGTVFRHTVTFVFMQTIDVVYYTHVYKLSVYISCV